MEVVVASRHTPIRKLREKHGDVAICDLTSRGPEPYVQFSPFFPHGGIPVPYSPGVFSMSVEGLWQGLKVFEGAGVDLRRLMLTSMTGLKRTVRKHGPCLGHARGVRDTEPRLGYVEARRAIYLPAYRWVLEHSLTRELASLRRLGARRKLLLLDYGTNGDVEDTSKPLSHAALVKAWLEDRWPV